MTDSRDSEECAEPMPDYDSVFNVTANWRDVIIVILGLVLLTAIVIVTAR